MEMATPKKEYQKVNGDIHTGIIDSIITILL